MSYHDEDDVSPNNRSWKELTMRAIKAIEKRIGCDHRMCFQHKWRGRSIDIRISCEKCDEVWNYTPHDISPGSEPE